ncbi:MAG: MarR family winged helix-turn-helix transcriptional regulator [Bacteroidia bacterium]|jgi:DNA-binding MarR family transcriptional regulator|nr:MarR family winged helix-turn-helix transcriptional regulator [Bacteroidia bacterium]
MPKKETTCSRIKQSWLAISRMYNNEAVKHDLTTTTGFILLNIDSKEGTPSTQIGPLLGMEATSLVRTMNQMEEKKIIKRKKDKLDARVVRIMLTPKGLIKKEVSKKTVKTFNQIIASKYSLNELEKFHAMLEDITQIAIDTKFNNS